MLNEPSLPPTDTTVVQNSLKNENSIDTAIGTCERKIKEHRVAGNRFLTIIALVLSFFAAYEVMQYLQTNNRLRYLSSLSTPVSGSARTYEVDSSNISHINNYIKANSIADQGNAQSLIIYGIFILIFGITTSFYRFHLKEISKFEHFLFGFQRIRIAGANSTTKYDDEVKTALTQDAFATEVKVKKERRVESPIPGHPTSDFGSAIINKLLDSIDFVAKPKE